MECLDIFDKRALIQSHNMHYRMTSLHSDSIDWQYVTGSTFRIAQLALCVAFNKIKGLR